MSESLSFEEHGEILAHWHALGLRAQTVVCLDRHLDLKRIADDDVARLRAAPDAAAVEALNRDVPFRDDDTHAYGLDDFVYGAAALGIVTRFVWVAPPLRLGENPDAARLAAALWRMLALVPGHGLDVLDSFTAVPWGAHARVGTLEVAITTVDGLADVPDLEGARLDIDLDYFCDEAGTLVDDPLRVADRLRTLGLAEHAPTMTYSVSSGFLPPALRRLGPALAQALGHSLAPAPRTRRRHWDCVDAIGGRQALDLDAIDDLWARELSGLGGAGWSARCLLELRAGDVDAARTAHERARDLGDRATWPAYALGLHLLETKRYAEAAPFLERAAARATDTISAHAHFLRAMCAFRLDELGPAGDWAQRCLALTPMWHDAHVLAAAVARRQGDADHAADHQRRARALVARQTGRDLA